MSVRSDSGVDVTVVLPVAGDRDAQGAVCTGDGRKPSNTNELNISGRDGQASEPWPIEEARIHE